MAEMAGGQLILSFGWSFRFVIFVASCRGRTSGFPDGSDDW